MSPGITTVILSCVTTKHLTMIFCLTVCLSVCQFVPNLILKSPSVCHSFFHSFIPLKFSSTVLHNSVRHAPSCRKASFKYCRGGQRWTSSTKATYLLCQKSKANNNGLSLGKGSKKILVEFSTKRLAPPPPRGHKKWCTVP